MVYLILTIVLVIACLAINVLVLMQEGKSAGLTSSISGSSDTYWSKNKGRSFEGKLGRFTKYLAIVIIVLAIVLNMGILK